jgi:hypothetical protein
VIACLLTGLCIASKLRSLQSLCGGGTMGCGEAWKMPTDGPAHVNAEFAYGRLCAWVAWFALLWACHSHPSSVHRRRSCRTPCQGCQNQPQSIHHSELSPPTYRLRRRRSCWRGLSMKPTIISIPPSNQTDHTRSSCLPGSAAG